MSARAAANQASASVRARDLPQASAHHPDQRNRPHCMCIRCGGLNTKHDHDESEDTNSHKDAICGFLEACSRRAVGKLSKGVSSPRPGLRGAAEDHHAKRQDRSSDRVACLRAATSSPGGHVVAAPIHRNAKKVFELALDCLVALLQCELKQGAPLSSLEVLSDLGQMAFEPRDQLLVARTDAGWQVRQHGAGEDLAEPSIGGHRSHPAAGVARAQDELGVGVCAIQLLEKRHLREDASAEIATAFPLDPPAVHLRHGIHPVRQQSQRRKTLLHCSRQALAHKAVLGQRTPWSRCIAVHGAIARGLERVLKRCGAALGEAEHKHWPLEVLVPPPGLT
mmetsp:Transcript_100630/g.323080  ORF Transcript_100630/g.323080 Transcript_100630/m.323080 type:complete len:337 (+) Transcript_100630:232-1242(+)